MRMHFYIMHGNILIFATMSMLVAFFFLCNKRYICYIGGAASSSADADKKEKAPKGGTAVKVISI